MKDIKFLASKYILGNHGRWNTQRQYEKEVQKVVKRIHGNLFVDIGAHQLFYCNLLSHNFKTIIAFEPNKNINPIIKHSNIKLLRTALSNEVGQSLFHSYGDFGADSLNKDFNYHVSERGFAPQQHGPFNSYKESFSVTVSTYDHLINEAPDLVMIDVEGSEFDVLNGMNKNLPKNIVVEIHNEMKTSELWNVVRSKGYEVKLVDVNHLFGVKI